MEEKHRTCRKCCQTKEIGKFRLSKPGYRRRVCSECMDAAAVAWQEANKDRSANWWRSYYQKNRKRQIAKAVRWNADNGKKKKQNSASWYRRKRMEVITSYGSKCACCGEEELSFLVIDHVNDDGHKFRWKKDGRPYGPHSGGSLLKHIIDSNFPSDFQVLCANCNTSKAINGGFCSHVKKVQRSER